MCFLCTGTIVSDRHVLTAAHCFKGTEPDYRKRQDGTVVEVRSGNTGLSYKKTNLKVHRKYDYGSPIPYPGYDIAIVELVNERFTFSDYDQPICMVDSFRENIGEVGYVAGYGAQSVNGSVRLKSGLWNVTYNDPDGEAHENLVPIGTLIRHSEKTICAVGNKRDTAQGDSGGPLMINRNGVWYQVGITSIGSMFDDDDGQARWFSLYTRLSRACDWIEEVTRGYVKCAPMGG